MTQLSVNEHPGFILNPLEDRPDTIEAAINRQMNGFRTTSDLCRACGVKDASYTEMSTIDATPEYLRIQLSLVGFDDEGTYKNQNAIGIPDILDLTQYMSNSEAENPWPVRYKLITATYHAGEDANSGHYVSAVTGPKEKFQKGPAPQYFCVDEDIYDWEGEDYPNVLTINPAEHNGMDFDTTMLFYVRIEPGRENLKPQETAEETAEEADAVVETIAERVRAGKLGRQCKR
ncbi:hypothetical protein N0V83_005553 [Neocucurbitaria cava]|uniref:ubiquitinyl hydrolase 1 n=1 Tax=Neocucurbitaria cava TaxID=798079 RepID=A0A9W9CLD8_9PLEO|nr:hypothetical protein N0V83_005553 [Neocucurbitaria cava]